MTMLLAILARVDTAARRVEDQLVDSALGNSPAPADKVLSNAEAYAAACRQLEHAATLLEGLLDRPQK